MPNMQRTQRTAEVQPDGSVIVTEPTSQFTYTADEWVAYVQRNADKVAQLNTQLLSDQSIATQAETIKTSLPNNQVAQDG